MESLYSIVAVVFVLVLLGGTLAVLRNRGNAVLNFGMKSGRVKNMEVTERMMLGPHHALYMVKLGERQVVLATSPSGCQFLLETVAEENPETRRGRSEL